MQVSLSSNGKQRSLLVHRIVAAAFLPPPLPEQTQVHHRNSDKTDNRAENLEWVTPQQNAQEALRKGEANAHSKLDRATVTMILNEFIATDATLDDLASHHAKHCHNPRETVRAILRRKRWAHVPCNEQALAAAYECKKNAHYGDQRLPGTAKVAAVRAAYTEAGATYASVAKAHGLGQELVRRIVKRTGRYARL
jgi:hypothetical protein